MKIEMEPHWNQLAENVSEKACRLDSTQLCTQARRKTGLDDFGEPSVEPALSILANSLETEANLHPLGRFLVRIHLLGILGARLKFNSQYRAHEHEFEDSLALAPIFITGMPRSGSTFLHELIVQDQSLRAPRVWEVMSPADAATPDRGWRDLRVWNTAWCLWCFRRLVRKVDAVYPMRARTPHECVAIQGHTLLSEEFISTAHVPAYERFLRAADLRPAYAWEKKFLRFLQATTPEQRWVLKSPDHVRGLEALFAEFPNALVVQTHRNPLDSLRSSIQLTEVLHRLYGRPRSRDQIARREAENLSSNMDRMIQFRDRHPELADRFIDVNYSELSEDPLRVVRRIFRHFDLPLSDETLARMQRLARSRSAYAGRHTAPTLAEVGLNPRAQWKLFGEYCRRFGISSGPAGIKLGPR
jgi:hypothetical protein